MTLSVGLTGGIGSGKSTASQYFSQFGAQIIDTDAIAKRLTEKDQPALEKVREEFPRNLFTDDGKLDRRKMRALIFSDARAKKVLEAILHPLIKQEVIHAMRTSTSAYQIVVVPLLFETNDYRELVTRALVIDCDEATQRQRAMAYHHLSLAQASAIMATQLPRQQRLAYADDVLYNNGGLEDLRIAVATLHQKYLQLSVNKSGAFIYD